MDMKLTAEQEASLEELVGDLLHANLGMSYEHARFEAAIRLGFSQGDVIREPYGLLSDPPVSNAVQSPDDNSASSGDHGFINMDEQERLRRGYRLMRGEGGFALVIALGVCTALAIAATATIELAARNETSARLSGNRMVAANLAEGGVNDAVSVLMAQHPGFQGQLESGQTVTLDGHDVEYGATWDGTSWLLYGIGHDRQVVQRAEATITPPSRALTWTRLP
jgi:hypothetical protein